MHTHFTFVYSQRALPASTCRVTMCSNFFEHLWTLDLSFGLWRFRNFSTYVIADATELDLQWPVVVGRRFAPSTSRRGRNSHMTRRNRELTSRRLFRRIMCIGYGGSQSITCTLISLAPVYD